MDTLIILLAGMALAAVLYALAQRLALGFQAQRPKDYDAHEPRFDIREVLNGPLLCEGVIYGPTGRVTSRFVADFEARWDGNRGVMTERFRYDSGSEQTREWRLTLGNDGRIRAEADDLVGPGEGEQSGASVQLRYRIRLPENAGGHVLDVNDWMYMVENGTIINRSQFRKFGIKVAELVATMRRKPA
ncbi:MAG: DUF3833 domain-containing protein [Rhodobacteraceae bacterium]|nr:DUF3833 domain-containing protein [Paracoccaceae bacterium]